MGGETLATPPGFHFFTSILILFTGMPLLLAQLITAAFFSAFIVFPAYLISRRIWRSHSAGLLATFFAAISALSFEMISWGGYTNVVSLALIAVIFYLFLRDIDQPSHFHLLMGTLLFGSLIITHTFSLFVFFPILILYFVLLLIGKRQKLKEMKILNALRFFTVSVALGILAVSPWVLRVLSFYMGASSEGALWGGMENNRNLILANRSVDPIISALIIVLIPTFFMFKASRKRYVDSGSLLLVAWFLVPIVMTQAYIFGIFTDYSRFMYFIDFPGIIIISAGLLYLCRYTSIAINKFSRIKWNKIKKALHVTVSTAILFSFIIASLWSIFPHEAMDRANFYTTIQKPEATALEWIQNRTPENSVLVTDHLYGWWLSGIGKRTTLSAASLEFLLYSHELEVAKSAQLLLDTDYYIDNGLIQVREDGSYLSRHNPEFSIETWSGKPFALLYFKNNETTLEYNQRNITLSDMEITENSILQYENSTLLTMTFENDLFTVKKTLTVQQGVRFAELSYEIETKNIQINAFDAKFTLHTTADRNITLEETSTQRMIGAYNSYHEVAGEVIITEPYPLIELVEQNLINCAEIIYNSQNNSIHAKMLVGIFDVEDLSYPYEVVIKYGEIASSPLETVTSEPLITWDYIEMMEEYDVSYVVCRDQDVYSKFSENPKFRMVFNGGNVAVFQVIK